MVLVGTIASYLHFITIFLCIRDKGVCAVVSHGSINE